MKSSKLMHENFLMLLLAASVVGCLVVSLLYTEPSHASSSAKKCTREKNRLSSIQQKQRKGHSAQAMARLKEKEDEAWRRWQQCKKVKSKPAKSKVKKKSKRQLQASNKPTKHTYPKPKVFNEHSPVIIKQDYQGDMQKRWLKFYQAPKQCNKPKDFNTFTWCVENKNAQKKTFEESQKKKGNK